MLGLPIEEAVAFWRKSLSTVTDDRFNKEHKYNIRHSYGLEGKRANYPARRCARDIYHAKIITNKFYSSCQQILLSDQPGASDCHGCPYRHFSHDNLQTALLSAYHDTLTAADLPEIMHTVKAGHPHVACTRVFEITHTGFGVKKGEGVGGGESVTHPNQYAARSRELEKVKQEVEAGPTDDSVAMEVS